VDRTSAGLKETGIIDDAKDLIGTIRAKVGSFSDDGQQTSDGEGRAGGVRRGGGGSINGQDLKELSTSFKEMLESVKALASELRVTVAESRKSGTVYNIEETFREASGTYRTIKDELK
jgi:hypothetical protein